VCLSIPSRVVKIDKENRVATVDTMGVMREASLALMSEDSVEVGDFVLIHIGFIMNKIDTADALSSIEAFNDVLKIMEDDNE